MNALRVLTFMPRTPLHCTRVLGVLASQAPAHSVSFSVPAHLMATLNIVLGGRLSHGSQELPAQFATGSHTRSRRYTISPHATLLTLFCRSDVMLELSGLSAQHFTDQWLSTYQVFPAWHSPNLAENACAADVAKAMLDSVKPPHLPQVTSKPDANLSALITVLPRMAHLPLKTVTQELGWSERRLQRLCSTYWGAPPKLLQRLMRLQHGLKLWTEQPTDLADLAAQIGLFDQAHLVREFRQLVGHPPRLLYAAGNGSQAQNRSSTDKDALWALETGNELLAPLWLSDFSKTASASVDTLAP